MKMIDVSAVVYAGLLTDGRKEYRVASFHAMTHIVLLMNVYTCTWLLTTTAFHSVMNHHIVHMSTYALFTSIHKLELHDF
jgi:hypothetical protein